MDGNIIVGSFSTGDIEKKQDVELPRAYPRGRFGTQERARRNIYIQNITVTTTPINIKLAEHIGIIIQNTGANDVYYSPSDTDLYQLFIAAGGAGFALDNHEQTNMFFKTNIGNSSLRIQTW